jgi:site-specific DNA recombinase
MKAYLYARVSSREQEREGYSIPAQKLLLHEYGAAKGFTIVREFIDVETAKSPGRKEFGKMTRLLQTDASCRVVLVEKTDRLYRNPSDTWHFGELIETRNVEVHLVKEGMVVSKDSRSHEKFMHDIRVALAKLYVDNLREEVVKGMAEKARQGFYPGHAPFGYRHDKLARTIALDSENAPIVARIFEAYENGDCTSLFAARDLVREQFGVRMEKSQVHRILRNIFYTGMFDWRGERQQGHHPPIVTPERFKCVQDMLAGRCHPKQRKHNFAFGGGLLRCGFCGCTVTAELKKGRYVYYRCSFGKGKCALPYMPEPSVSEKLGDVLKGIYIPEQAVSSVVESIRGDSDGAEKRRQEELVRLQQRLAVLRTRKEKMYEDKLDARIDEEFWQRKNTEFCEQEVTLASELEKLSSPVCSDQRALTAKKILELAHKAHFLYLTRNAAERAQLLKMVLSNCSTDGASFTPTYRKPFDAIFERAKNENWSGR